ncbi:MAG: hypothetical protein IPJ03_03450 [Ignavibacteriales bacterium]|nr:hypothetical protein [Ignavibacteriales bacterium]
MSNAAKKEYINEIRERYFSSTKTEKSFILDELCEVCKFNRKYAIRLIRKKQTEQNKKKGRPKKYYSQGILEFLKDLLGIDKSGLLRKIKSSYCPLVALLPPPQQKYLN